MGHFRSFGVNVLVIDKELSCDFHIHIVVVKPVQRTQLSGLSTSRGSNDARNALIRNRHVDILQNMISLNVNIQIFDHNMRIKGV